MNKRQYDAMVKRVDQLTFEGKFFGTSYLDVFIHFMNSNVRVQPEIAHNEPDWFFATFVSHGSKMFFELRSDYQWHVGYVSAINIESYM